MKIGVLFGSPETTPGGRALKFYTSVRIDVRRIAQIKKGEEIIGSRTRAKVVKNKVASPFKAAEFDLVHNEGIARASELLVLGEKYGLVSKSGASYSYGSEKLGRGYDAARESLKENPKVAGALEKDIKTALQQKV